MFNEAEILEEFAIDEALLAEPDTAPLPSIQSLPQPAPSSAAQPWDPKLTFDLALGIDRTEDIIARHGITEDALISLFHNRLFTMEVANLKKELQTDGVTIRSKAKLQFESYLPVLNTMIHDIDTSAATKHAMIRTVGDVGDVWPKKTQDDGKDAMTGVNIQINIG